MNAFRYDAHALVLSCVLLDSDAVGEKVAAAMTRGALREQTLTYHACI